MYSRKNGKAGVVNGTGGLLHFYNSYEYGEISMRNLRTHILRKPRGKKTLSLSTKKTSK
jgi:hypothetical protein